MNKLIIFDCDGVLVDSEIIGHRFFAEAMSANGYPLPIEQSIRKFNGINDQTAWQMIYDETGKDVPFNVFEEYHPLVTAAFETDLAPLMVNVLKMLDRQGITRCVASSSPRDHVVLSLKLTSQLNYFEDSSIFTSQQVAKGKPEPDLFLFAAKQMGYRPENCLVIEDSFAGIQAAKAAGMDVIGFLGGSHSKYDWYHEELANYNIPIAHDENDLLQLLGCPLPITLNKKLLKK